MTGQWKKNKTKIAHNGSKKMGCNDNLSLMKADSRIKAADLNRKYADC